MFRQVLEYYELSAIDSVDPLGGAGGFSGSQFWRLHSAQHGPLCLRRWPREHPSEQRLQTIHQFQLTLSAAELPVPVPLPDRNGRTAVRHCNAWWELTAWMPGTADFQMRPSDARLHAAMEKLAQLHLASAQWRTPNAGPSPAAKQRFEMLADVPLWTRRIGACMHRLEAPIRMVGESILKHAPAAAAKTHHRFVDVLRLVTPLQWVLRDIWHDHVLFVDEHVTGIVDFGAISHDTVATDIARLLASLVGDQWSQWELGLAAYEQVRPLSSSERELIFALDRAAVVLSGLNWLQWLAVEQRDFTGREGEIARRIATLETRLAAFSW